MIVLLYHRVTNLSFDPQLLSVTPEHFEQHMEVLEKSWSPISLAQVPEMIRRGGLPDRGVAVTFDDGYADNLQYAKPVLAAHSIPATIFVTSGYVGQNREFWWDELERLILGPHDLPSELRLDVGDHLFHWTNGGEEAGEGQADPPDSNWNVLSRSAPHGRQKLYLALCERLRSMREGMRREILDLLLTWSGSGSAARPSHLPMRESELKRMEEGGLIQIGAHAHTHTPLSALTPDQQEWEIVQCRQNLGPFFSVDAPSFSYPFGTPSDYTDDTVRAVREAGFGCAVSNFPGQIGPNTDCFQLPRFIVRNWDGSTFVENLKRWCGEG